MSEKAIWEYLKTIESILGAAIGYKGQFYGDFDDLDSGIYKTPSSSMTDHLPVTDQDFWGYTVSIRFDDSCRFQFALLTGNASGLYYRKYEGNPLAWTSWTCITRSGTKVLWTGTMIMNENQTVPLSQPVSQQSNGIVLCWSAYSGGTTYNYDWVYTFVPKWHVQNYSNAGIHCSLGTPSNKTFGDKYVYVTDTQIKGNTMNDDTSVTIANSFVRNNSYWVLRAVLGV